MDNERLLAAFSYLGWFLTGILVLLVTQNRFARFHAMQSIILFGGIFISFLILFFIPIVGWIINYFVGLAAFFLWVLLIWKSVSGEEYKVPIIGEMAEKQLGRI